MSALRPRSKSVLVSIENWDDESYLAVVVDAVVDGVVEGVVDGVVLEVVLGVVECVVYGSRVLVVVTGYVGVTVDVSVRVVPGT